jgi:Zn ribbon nucleic-acid-binding protein
MEQAFENHSIMRCPVCFTRDIDVLMEQEPGLHYCIKCGFRGPESEVRGMYKDIQKKFHGTLKRYTLEDQRAL